MKKQGNGKNYVNPLNQVFLFLGGFLIGFFFHDKKIKNWIVISLFLIALVVFIFYPVTGAQINVKIGISRLIFTACCFAICFCFYKLSFRFPKVIHKPLAILGEASYSVYLLHPIINDLIGRLGKYIFHYPNSVRILISIFTTLIVSYFVYQYFEKIFYETRPHKKK